MISRVAVFVRLVLPVPSGFMMKISPFVLLGPVGTDAPQIIFEPSGDQEGAMSGVGTFVSCNSWVPSASTTYTSPQTSVRNEAKTIFDPSGDHFGSVS